MAVWLYSGQSATGRPVEGEINAENRDEARSLLRKKRIMAGKLKKKPIEIHLSFLEQVTVKDMARFTRQFSAMNSAGLPLIQSLSILEEQTEKKKLKEAVAAASGDIQGGSTLADALAKHPKVFSDLYCHMVAAGEAGGILDSVLLRLAEYQEKSEKLIRKIKKALYYPAFVFLFSVAVIFVLLVYVVPIFEDLFTSMSGELPPATLTVLAVSEFLQNYFIYMAGAGLLAGLGVYRYQKTEKGRYLMDKWMLYWPLVGDLIRKSSVSRFTRTLSTLLGAGVPIIESLRITSKTAGNKVLERGILRALESISGGQTIADPLQATKIFPPMVIQMIHVGEKTGGLSEMLAKVSDFYDDEVDASVDGITSLIEPAVIVFLGIFIGAILIAMYLPMFDLAGTIQ